MSWSDYHDHPAIHDSMQVNFNKSFGLVSAGAQVPWRFCGTCQSLRHSKAVKFRSPTPSLKPISLIMGTVSEVLRSDRIIVWIMLNEAHDELKPEKQGYIAKEMKQ
jgi:hypothetical protein